MRKRVYQNRVLPILTEDSAFHGLNAAGKKPIRSIEMTEINSSFMMMFPLPMKRQQPHNQPMQFLMTRWIYLTLKF